jgi:adenylate cyclase
MDAKALAAFLNDYLGSMTRIVFAHDGTLDKYIGDAVMAFWGAPLDQPKHAYNCATAAIAMMKALADNRERFKTQYDVEVNIGIGINTGVVNVGNMGSDTNFEYTVIGDHVNLASRLEGLTKAYGVSIVTTRFTMDHIKELGVPLPAHRILDHVKVKGKKNAVELIQLTEGTLSELGMKLFEEGQKLYAQQQWDSAIAKFNEANHAFGGKDGPCAVYIERCEDFKKAPPESDWDGSWEMHSK